MGMRFDRSETASDGSSLIPYSQDVKMGQAPADSLGIRSWSLDNALVILHVSRLFPHGSCGEGL